jgi:hypothetical protein
MAMLVALAALAERAAARSYPVRCFVLWLLRRAEAVAEEFVFEATGTPAIGGIAAVGNGPADAIRLAARFRALAAALGALLRPGQFCPCRNARVDAALRRFARRAGRLPLAFGCWTRKPFDTS